MYIFIFILLVFLLIIKYLTNQDNIKENCKTETDIANIKNARKYYIKTRTAKIVLISAIVLILIFALCQFTSLEAIIIDYISFDFYNEKDFNISLYLIPLYLLVIRSIVIEVKVGDYIYKYFEIDEPELEENPLTNLLYKKKPGEGKLPKETKNTTNAKEESKENTEEKPKDANPQ